MLLLDAHAPVTISMAVPMAAASHTRVGPPPPPQPLPHPPRPTCPRQHLRRPARDHGGGGRTHQRRLLCRDGLRFWTRCISSSSSGGGGGSDSSNTNARARHSSGSSGAARASTTGHGVPEYSVTGVGVPRYGIPHYASPPRYQCEPCDEVASMRPRRAKHLENMDAEEVLEEDKDDAVELNCPWWNYQEPVMYTAPHSFTTPHPYSGPHPYGPSDAPA